MIRIRQPGGLLAAGALLGGLMAGIVATAPTAGATPSCTGNTTVTCTFSFTGSPDSFSVPTGVTSVTIDALGAQGGSSEDNTSGGQGGEATATITVTPHESLQIDVGGSPAEANPASGGFNGGGTGGSACCSSYPLSLAGGGGGGASDVRKGGTDLAHRVVVAGGGGGGGVGTTGSPPTSCAAGTGGGTDGGDAASCGNTGAFGGTQTAGGSYSAGSSPSGTAGTSGSGGRGGNDSGICCYESSASGGGGGGGLFGGGGGTGAGSYSGGGGGGSGFTPSGTGMTNGVRSGSGEVTITYTAPPTLSSVVSSQQFGIPNQTDVFRLAPNGAVEVSWVAGAGQWNGPLAISPPGLASPGSRLAVSNQYGIPNQTDVFVVDKTGTTDVLWVTGGGAWNGPMAITGTGLAPAGASLAVSNQFGISNQTDLFVVDKTGTTDVLWVAGGGAWNGPMALTGTGLAPAGAALAVSNQFGIASQTDLFVVGNDGATRVSWVDGAGNWNGPSPITPSGLSPGGASLAASPQYGVANQTDVFVVGNDGASRVSWVDGTGNWNGPSPITPSGLSPGGASLAVSNQFGIPNQTDVFVVGNDGTSRVSWVNGAGNWNGPSAITPSGLSPWGAGLTASPQYGVSNQTDVFVVGNDGASRVSWVDGAGHWNGPMAI